MKDKLSKIGLYFTCVTLILLIASQTILFIFEYELNTTEGGLFAALEVVNKYQALDNIWFAMSSQILTIMLFIILVVFIIRTLVTKNKLHHV